MNIIDAEDVYLSAKAEVEEVISNTIGDWFAPMVKDSFMVYMLSLPPEVRVNLEALAGEDNVKQVFEGLEDMLTKERQ